MVPHLPLTGIFNEQTGDERSVIEGRLPSCQVGDCSQAEGSLEQRAGGSLRAVLLPLACHRMKVSLVPRNLHVLGLWSVLSTDS